MVLHAKPDEATRSSKSKLVMLEWSHGYSGYRADMSGPASRAVLPTTQRAAAGPVAVLPMMGGSVPIHLFATNLDAPVIGLPIANHDNNQHAANESARLQNLWDGIETYAAMLGELSWQALSGEFTAIKLLTLSDTRERRVGCARFRPRRGKGWVLTAVRPASGRRRT